MSTTSKKEKIISEQERISKYTKILKGIYIATVIILCIGALATAIMPVMSCDDILIRNTNLAEFSSLGVVVFIMPILLAAILLSHLSKSSREVMYAVMFVITYICHAQSMTSSYNWLTEVTNGCVKYHYGLQLPLVILFVIFLLCFVYEHINFKNLVTYCVRLVDRP